MLELMPAFLPGQKAGLLNRHLRQTRQSRMPRLVEELPNVLVLQPRKLIHRLLVFECPLIIGHVLHSLRPIPFIHRDKHTSDRSLGVFDDGGKVSDIARVTSLHRKDFKRKRIILRQSLRRL